MAESADKKPGVFERIGNWANERFNNSVASVREGVNSGLKAVVDTPLTGVGEFFKSALQTTILQPTLAINNTIDSLFGKRSPARAAAQLGYGFSQFLKGSVRTAAIPFLTAASSLWHIADAIGHAVTAPTGYHLHSDALTQQPPRKPFHTTTDTLVSVHGMTKLPEVDPDPRSTLAPEGKWFNWS